MKVLFLILLLAPIFLATYMPTREPFSMRVDWSKFPKCIADPCVCSCNGQETVTEGKVKLQKRRNLLVGRYGFRIGKREDGEEYQYPEGNELDALEKQTA